MLSSEPQKRQMKDNHLQIPAAAPAQALACAAKCSR